MRRLRLVLLALALLHAPALAVQPDEVLPDPALEARARALSKELRCMVCQNQSIDDSDAPLARDLRVLVRERLAAGDSDTQVVDFLVARYGEFVLLNPRVGWHTALLWLAPAAVLIGGAIGLVVLIRRRRGANPTVAEQVAARTLTPEEEARLARLLDESGEPRP
ncbi:MAG: cytochrome c-type biogenesis protein CcmH [Xanthobacteraceae bacterium]|nr:cytochrome c-type biogenesis protein CcmH [Xanthobacteraceae bacterium]GIL02802.1 MAG: cytochrome c-type biogenesis protein CcmH [Alphaproteobacteria bacterium]